MAITSNIFLNMVSMTPTFKPKPDGELAGWYHIPGYSKYRANRKGEILTLKTGNVSKGGQSDRYLRVSVYKDGSKEATLEYLHDLICLAFHGPRPKDHVCSHKDDNRMNNKANNLRWITQSKNIELTYKNGLRKPTTKKNLTVSKESFIYRLLQENK